MYKIRDLWNKDGATKMKKPHKYEAVCSSYPSKKKGEERQFGVVMFYLASSARSGTVSHEMTHATTYWWKSAEKGDIFNNPKADEKYAQILGSLVRQYWEGWYKWVKKK